jgi:signal transduction histidine kinase
MICEWFNTPLRDSRGQIRGVASMAMDVSEREASEAQVRDAQKLESLGILAGGVAHDFNSSLMVILGNVALLHAIPGLPSKAVEYADVIEDAGLRAGKFIGHLLTYARTGRHNPQPTDLNNVLTEVSTLVRSAMGNKHELVITTAPKLPKILADRSQIEQVVLNLCLNAQQAEPADHTVGVTTRLVNLTATRAKHCVPQKLEPGQYVELAVLDDGVGMDEATLRRIFVPFFTTKAEGHGLGLAAVLGILRQHGAAAHIESTPGKGTHFRVFFPIHRKAPEKTEPHRRRGKAKRSR